MHKISGKIIFLEMGPDSWGIEGDDGRQWLPIDMPNQLKVRGERVVVTARDSDFDSVFMWGTPIDIVTFHTLPRY
jgi:hypothetical protein